MDTGDKIHGLLSASEVWAMGLMGYMPKIVFYHHEEKMFVDDVNISKIFNQKFFHLFLFVIFPCESWSMINLCMVEAAHYSYSEIGSNYRVMYWNRALVVTILQTQLYNSTQLSRHFLACYLIVLVSQRQAMSQLEEDSLTYCLKWHRSLKKFYLKESKH